MAAQTTLKVTPIIPEPPPGRRYPRWYMQHTARLVQVMTEYGRAWIKMIYTLHHLERDSYLTQARILQDEEHLAERNARTTFLIGQWRADILALEHRRLIHYRFREALRRPTPARMLVSIETFSTDRAWDRTWDTLERERKVYNNFLAEADKLALLRNKIRLANREFVRHSIAAGRRQDTAERRLQRNADRGFESIFRFESLAKERMVPMVREREARMRAAGFAHPSYNFNYGVPHNPPQVTRTPTSTRPLVFTTPKPPVEEDEEEEEDDEMEL